MFSESGQTECESGLDGAQRDFKNRGDFGQRHFLLKMQDEDGAAGRRQGVAVQQLLQELVGRRCVGRRHRVEHGIVPGLFHPAFFSTEMTETCAARDPKCPWSKELWRLQPREFSAHEDERVLQDVIGVASPDETGQVAMERRLDAAQQKLESFAIAALRPEDPLSFLPRSGQTVLSHYKRLREGEGVRPRGKGGRGRPPMGVGLPDWGLWSCVYLVGSSDARYAEMLTMSSSLRLATGRFISAASPPFLRPSLNM